ncbi:MAG: pilus assembly protein N-terminal domain-containing protein [Candidatus Omnitrophica bacterium]|nr:pilus assembly protein N-terminal domain-containing protein [Candidatus Omnitrophota bacterium]
MSARWRACIFALILAGTRASPVFAGDQFNGYGHYLAKGIEAMNNHDDKKAFRYFILAQMYDPSAKDPEKYIQRLNQAHAMAAPSAAGNGRGRFLRVPLKKAKGPAQVISLSDMDANSPAKATVQVELGSSIIIEGMNIQKFLVANEGFIMVKHINRDQIQIDAQKRGSTFLHIWDGSGRRTIYVEVVFPSTGSEDISGHIGPVEHAQPFKFTYSNDWSSYYYGDNVPGLERQSVNFQQNFAINGDTPYGAVDASTTLSQFNAPLQVLTYTAGLSNVPVEGTSGFNLRAFDAQRYLTPLTMPATRLRGAFADVDLFQDIAGLSLSHGQKRSTFGFISQGSNVSRDSYIDAVKIALFPKDRNHQYAFNIAAGHGAEHPPYLTKRVYSIEGRRAFDGITLNGEIARDQAHHAALAGTKWEKGPLNTALNFRNVNRNFNNVSSFPPNQGEIGAAWTTGANLEKFSTNTFVDVYRDRFYFNPNDPEALNYDANARVRVPFSRDLWSETNGYYTYTPGELSPRRNGSLHERFSKYFDVWGGRKGTFYAGGAYQRSRYAHASASEYDRHALIAGAQLPLTGHLSSFANYEYSWVHEILSGEHLNPNVLNAGLGYNKQLTQGFSVSSQLTYRDEQGVRGTNSFLAGEDSAGASIGFSYSHANDINFFADGRLRRVWPQAEGNVSYNDLDIRLGMRVVFDMFPGWDPRGHVSGLVFKDKNSNGKPDPEEPGIGGVKIKIGDKEAVTDQQGRFRMNIRAKRVMVTPVLESIPSGLIFSTPTFSKVDIAQGRASRVDFGLMSQTGIYGVVFVDKNGNGTPDSGDQFIRRVKLILDGRMAQTSDGRGAYFFRSVAEGKHTIALDLNTVPLDMLPMVKLKNEIQVAEGTTYILNIPMKIKKD